MHAGMVLEKGHHAVANFFGSFLLTLRTQCEASAAANGGGEGEPESGGGRPTVRL